MAIHPAGCDVVGVARRLVDVNSALRIPLEAERPKRFDAWTGEQVGTFLGVAAGHRPGTLFELAFLTGMRRGELCGLDWSAVDLASRTLRVERTRVQSREGIVESTPKTDSGVRTVTLDDAPIGALLASKFRQQAERDLWGKAWRHTGYVFTMEDGTPVKPDYATRLFEKLRHRAELPKITLHGARHEHASLWIAAGATSRC